MLYEQKIAEALEKHRKIKVMLLDLLTKAPTPNYSKERIQDELWLIYQELK